MTSKNNPDAPEDETLGVLDEAASLDTTSLGVLGQTAQVNVVLPQNDDDDDLVDDSVVDGEILSELIVDDAPVSAAAVSSVVREQDEVEVGRIQPDRIGIVIEVPADTTIEKTTDAVIETDVAAKQHPDAADESSDAAEAIIIDAEFTDAPLTDAEPVSDEPIDVEAVPVVAEPVVAEPEPIVAERESEPAVAASEPEPEPVPAPKAAKKSAKKSTKKSAVKAPAKNTVEATEPAGEPAVEPATEPVVEPATAAPKRESAPRPTSATSAWISEAMKQNAPVEPEPEPAPAAALEPVVEPVPTASNDSEPDTEPETSAPAEETKSETVTDSPESSKPAEKAIVQRPAAARPETQLSAKRLDDQRGRSSRESADLLTADRLLDPHQMSKPEPEGAWSHLLYTISGHRINIGDGKRARARKALTARIAAPLSGGARFVPVMSRKGGVGKTTITTLLGMALADARDDRVIAVDANPDRGTLSDRIQRTQSRSVRDLVRIHEEITGYHDVSAIVARDSTRLDVLASDTDPRVAEAFSDEDYRDVAGVAARYYSLVLTDTGTGIVHSVMGATLDLADQLVIVSGLSVDEARLASETLTWLETNGYEDQARNAIIVLNQSTPGSPLVRLNELEAHFGTRARTVVRMPYDPQIAGGGAIVYANLQPATRQAARELAALLVEGLRASAA